MKASVYAMTLHLTLRLRIAFKKIIWSRIVNRIQKIRAAIVRRLTGNTVRYDASATFAHTTSIRAIL